MITADPGDRHGADRPTGPETIKHRPTKRRENLFCLRAALLPALLQLCLAAPAVVPASAQEDLLAPLLSKKEEAPAPASPSIEPGLDPQEDEAIAQRLTTMYGTVEGLAPVQVRVASGVVVLMGEVSTQAVKEQAARLARNVRGVAEVENRIVVAQDLEGRLTPALERLADAWRNFVRLLPVLFVGLGIVVGAVLFGRWLARRRALYRRLAANDFLARLLGQVVQATVLFLGAALALLLLDATGIITTLLGAAGIFGLAVGFALRDTVENYIASILLSLRRPFDPEDFVRIEDQEGIVARLTSRATILLTLDGNHVRIPNATVFKGLIINFTADPHRRFTFDLGVAPVEDLARAQRTAIEALADVRGVLSSPGPSALYVGVGESTVNLTVAGWVDQRNHDFLRVRSEAIRVVLTRMGEAGVDLPEPTVRLRSAPKLSAPGAAGRTPSATPTALPAVSTGRDAALDRVVERERSGRPDLLERDGPQE